VSPAERWLRARLPGAPPELLDAMAAALPAEDGGPLPEALAAGALRLYAGVLHGTGGREDALPLLAADALMTHALEAQAEADPDALEDFAARWGAAGELGRLAERAARP
jgi:hypothetical protein